MRRRRSGSSSGRSFTLATTLLEEVGDFLLAHCLFLFFKIWKGSCQKASRDGMNYDSPASRSISASLMFRSIWSTVLSYGTVDRLFRFRSDCDDDGVLRGLEGGVKAT